MSNAAPKRRPGLPFFVLAAACGGVTATACVHIPQNVHDTFEPWQPGEPGNFRAGAKKEGWKGPVDFDAPRGPADAGDPAHEAPHGVEPGDGPVDAASIPYRDLEGSGPASHVDGGAV